MDWDPSHFIRTESSESLDRIADDRPIMSLLHIIADPSSGQSASSFALSPSELQDVLGTPPIDVRLLMEQCSGNASFAVALLEEFARTGHDRVLEMDEEFAQGNLGAIAKQAHSLIGVAGIMAAGKLVEVTMRLQAAARAEDLVLTRELVRQLRHEMRRVLDDIPHVCAMVNQQRNDAR